MAEFLIFAEFAEDLIYLLDLGVACANGLRFLAAFALFL